MIWHYTDKDGNPAGPISEEEFQAAVKSGVIHGDTLVWKEGFAGWIKYSGISQGASGGNAAVASGTRCSECAREYAPEEMANFAGEWVCAGCKPLYVQKFREGAPTGSVSLWRSGKQLVTPIDSVLPQRCVKCNAPTDAGQMKRKLYWHHPAVYLALFLNVIVYVIAAMCTRKRASTTLSICPRHRAVRRNAIIVSWLLILGGIATFIGGLASDAVWVWCLGLVIFVGAIFYGIIRGRLVFAKKIDKEHVWLGGCKPEFLAEFPEWTGSK